MIAFIDLKILTRGDFRSRLFHVEMICQYKINSWLRNNLKKKKI